MAKKEKTEKPKKEKKPKEKKPPKEKKVKEKKPKEKKPPKPKKEKAPKKKKAEEGEGGKKGGKKTLLLVLILVVVVAAAAVAAVFTLRSIGGKGEDQTLEETGDGEEGEDGEEGDEGEDGEESGEPGEDADETPAPATTPDPLRVTTAMTTAEMLEYVRRFTPASLGLSGDSMDDYEIYASENVVLVDGYTCTELSVYSKDASAGTNDIEGWYLISRGSGHKLFRLNKETGQLTELDPERNTDSS